MLIFLLFEIRLSLSNSLAGTLRVLVISLTFLSWCRIAFAFAIMAAFALFTQFLSASDTHGMFPYQNKRVISITGVQHSRIAGKNVELVIHHKHACSSCMECS